MPFKPTLVSPREIGAAYPYLGQEVAEIILEQPNLEGAAIPSHPSPDVRDKIIEAVTGSDAKVDKRKLSEIEFEIDYISTEKKEQIERLFFDGRDVYISPNYGPRTQYSMPFQRSIKDITGQRVMGIARTGDAFAWDEDERILRAWDDNEAAFPIGGHWLRYLKTQAGSDNKAVKPAPNLAGHSWTTVAGSVSYAYTESVLTPLLHRRGIVDGKGVVAVDVPNQAGVATIQHAITGTISTTNSVVGGLVIQTSGFATAKLLDGAGATVYDTKTIIGDGRPQLIKLGGLNSNAANTARIQIDFLSSGSKSYIALISGVFIGSDVGANPDPQIDDWHSGVSNFETLTSNDFIETFLTEGTVSFFMKYAENQIGIVEIGAAPAFTILKTELTDASPDAMRCGHDDGAGGTVNTDWQNIGSVNNLSVGDWIHVVIEFSHAGSLKCYINGMDQGTTGSWHSMANSSSLRFGNVFGASFLCDSGLSHFRLDDYVWTPAEVTDHYDTYFGPRRGNIEPVFGKLGRLIDMEWSGRYADGSMQWVGSLTWRELGPDVDHAPMIRQEGDI